MRCLSALCAHGTRQITQRCRKFDQQSPSGSHIGGRHVGHRVSAGFFSRVRHGHVRHGRGRARAGEPRPRPVRPKLFAASCVQCHKSARGLAKGRMSFTLSYYLRQHYTSSAASAGTSPPTCNRSTRRPPRRKPARRKRRRARRRRRTRPRAQRRAQQRSAPVIETADRHDQRGSARATAGEDPGAVIAAIGLTIAHVDIGIYSLTDAPSERRIGAHRSQPRGASP